MTARDDKDGGMIPLLERFDNAVRAGDIADARACLQVFQALAAAQASTPSHALSIGELRLLAAGWVMEIHGEHQNHADLRTAAKAYAKEQGPEDDTEVHTILRRILIPEGRRSPPAGALVSGSPHPAARDANPGSAVPGGGSALSTTRQKGAMAELRKLTGGEDWNNAAEWNGDIKGMRQRLTWLLDLAERHAAELDALSLPSAIAQSAEAHGDQHEPMRTALEEIAKFSPRVHNGRSRSFINWQDGFGALQHIARNALKLMNRADGGKQTNG